jgi:uncharacterized protein (DUF1330 family)
MVNLVRFRERASYPADYSGDASPDCSGREAMHRFAAAAFEYLVEYGARIVLHSSVDGVYLGDMDQGEWDEVTVIEYPSLDAVAALTADPDYQAVVVHRTAALDRYVLLATRPVFDASVAQP